MEELGNIELSKLDEAVRKNLEQRTFEKSSYFRDITENTLPGELRYVLKMPVGEPLVIEADKEVVSVKVIVSEDADLADMESVEAELINIRIGAMADEFLLSKMIAYAEKEKFVRSSGNGLVGDTIQQARHPFDRDGVDLNNRFIAITPYCVMTLLEDTNADFSDETLHSAGIVSQYNGFNLTNIPPREVGGLYREDLGTGTLFKLPVWQKDNVVFEIGDEFSVSKAEKLEDGGIELTINFNVIYGFCHREGINFIESFEPILTEATIREAS